MPFDMAPQETKVGAFQKFADAILAGCEKSDIQCIGRFFFAGATCALGAMALGLGFDPSKYEDEGDVECAAENALPDGVCNAYRARYGATIPEDNDKNGFSREQIAARIAAL